MHKTLFILIFSVLLLSGCAEKVARPATSYYMTNGLLTELLPLTELELTEQVSLSGRFGGEEHTVLSIISFTPEKLIIAAVSGFVKLFVIEYAEDSVRYELSSLVSIKNFEPEYIVSDVQFICYPLSSLQQLLPRNVSVLETEADGIRTRLFYHGSYNFAFATYLPDGTRLYENLERGYKYRMERL